MDLSQFREQIDQADDTIVRAFSTRMEIAAQIAAYKKQNNLPVFVPQREMEKLADVASKAGPKMERYTRALYNMLFELSRSYQNKCNCEVSPLYQRISYAIKNTPEHFPASATVACLDEMCLTAQNVCEKIFDSVNIRHFSCVNDLFHAIDVGHCRYGILPIENSTAGFMLEVYDLMVRYGFYTVSSLGLPGRYICISKELEVYPGSNRTSIMAVLPNQPDALYCLLTRLYILGIHLARMELCHSCYGALITTIYFDLDISVTSEEFKQLFSELEQLCENFQYLGSFCEVV